MKEVKKITVFTPTYNRAYILSQLYESLKKQFNKSFVWLIVDDGSIDNTDQLVRKWISESIIEIRYYKQKNGGKQRAHNKGVELCDTELFICVDSDDYLTNDAINLLISNWDCIENKDRVSGIVSLKGKNKDSPIGTWMPAETKYTSLNKLYKKYKFRGDTALLFRTEILREFPFFVAENEKFIGESYVYIQIDQYYEMVTLNRIICICEYLSDGYSANIKNNIKNNPKGYMILKKQAAILSTTYKDKYKNTVGYLIGCLLCNEKQPIKMSPFPFLSVLAFPAAIVLFNKWYR